MPSEEELAKLWQHVPRGQLSAKEQLRAATLRDAMKEFRGGSFNRQGITNKFIVGGGWSPTRGPLA